MKIRLPFIVLVLLNLNAFSQKVQKNYTIKSFEGITQKIELSEADRGRTVIIKCGTNQLAIYDCYGITEVHPLKDKFLEVIYEPRGGSGFTPYQVLILCVSNNKLITAMDVMYGCQTVDVGAELNYSAKPTLIGDNNKGYKLSINIHDEVIGKSGKWGGPYNKHKTVVLAFDPVTHIFYSGHKKVDQLFKFFGEPKQKHIMGNLPFIDINDEVYYFIDDLWHKLSHANDPPGPYQMKGDYLNAEVTRIH